MSATTETPMTARIPISTLTTLPCPHGPGKECMECVGEGRLRLQGLAELVESREVDQWPQLS